MKTEVEKLQANKLVNAPITLNNLKTKVDELDVAKLKPVPVHLKEISNLVSKNVAKNTKFNTIKTKVNKLGKKKTMIQQKR